MTNWELWACATHMRNRHGEDAAVHAAMRADGLLDAGDGQGHAVWTTIVRYIAELEATAGEGVTRH